MQTNWTKSTEISHILAGSYVVSILDSLQIPVIQLTGRKIIFLRPIWKLLFMNPLWEEDFFGIGRASIIIPYQFFWYWYLSDILRYQNIWYALSGLKHIHSVISCNYSSEQPPGTSMCSIWDVSVSTFRKIKLRNAAHGHCFHAFIVFAWLSTKYAEPSQSLGYFLRIWPIISFQILY